MNFVILFFQRWVVVVVAAVVVMSMAMSSASALKAISTCELHIFLGEPGDNFVPRRGRQPLLSPLTALTARLGVRVPALWMLLPLECRFGGKTVSLELRTLVVLFPHALHILQLIGDAQCLALVVGQRWILKQFQQHGMQLVNGLQKLRRHNLRRGGRAMRLRLRNFRCSVDSASRCARHRFLRTGGFVRNLAALGEGPEALPQFVHLHEMLRLRVQQLVKPNVARGLACAGPFSADQLSAAARVCVDAGLLIEPNCFVLRFCAYSAAPRHAASRHARASRAVDVEAPSEIRQSNVGDALLVHLRATDGRAVRLFHGRWLHLRNVRVYNPSPNYLATGIGVALAALLALLLLLAGTAPCRARRSYDAAGAACGLHLLLHLTLAAEIMVYREVRLRQDGLRVQRLGIEMSGRLVQLWHAGKVGTAGNGEACVLWRACIVLLSTYFPRLRLPQSHSIGRRCHFDV
mmetsp:Transcript_26874/g.67665  ORF Transcript_26874/g.67665 Transcript_26874/m.67665 type:complete len:463 (+) Transcript_26874:1603-2991(+)